MLDRHQVAARWRAVTFERLTLRPARVRRTRPGHTGGRFFEWQDGGRMVYAPGGDRSARRGEREAHDLGVNVPPVVLTESPPDWPGRSPVCASLVMGRDPLLPHRSA